MKFLNCCFVCLFAWAFAAGLAIAADGTQSQFDDDRPDLVQTWYEMNRTILNSKLKGQALVDKLLTILMKGTVPSFMFSDRKAESIVDEFYLPCHMRNFPDRAILLDTALRLSLLENAVTGVRRVTYEATLASDGVNVDAIFPSAKPSGKPTVARVLTIRGGRIVNTVLTAKGIQTVCSGRYGPLWFDN